MDVGDKKRAIDQLFHPACSVQSWLHVRSLVLLLILLCNQAGKQLKIPVFLCRSSYYRIALPMLAVQSVSHSCHMWLCPSLSLSLSLNHCRCDALGELFVELLIVRLHFGESKYVGFKMKGSRKQAVEESQKRRARQWQISRMDPNIQWHANELDIYRKCLLAGGLLLRKDIQY